MDCSIRSSGRSFNQTWYDLLFIWCLKSSREFDKIYNSLISWSQVILAVPEFEYQVSLVLNSCTLDIRTSSEHRFLIENYTNTSDQLKLQKFADVCAIHSVLSDGKPASWYHLYRYQVAELFLKSTYLKDFACAHAVCAGQFHLYLASVDFANRPLQLPKETFGQSQFEIHLNRHELASQAVSGS